MSRRSSSLSKWLIVLVLAAAAGGYWAFRPGGVLRKSSQPTAITTGDADAPLQLGRGLLEKSAERGDAYAQLRLGQAYYAGNGVAQSYAEAAKWFRKAAEQGLASAQLDLGRMFENGEGVLKDAAQAVAWYRKAAEQGNAKGQYNLGLMIAKEQGAPKDYVEAYKWANLAAAQGQPSAKELRRGLEQRMTPEEIAEAQRRSVAFVPKKTP